MRRRGHQADCGPTREPYGYRHPTDCYRIPYGYRQPNGVCGDTRIGGDSYRYQPSGSSYRDSGAHGAPHATTNGC